MASGSRDKTIIRWDVATRQRIGPPLTGHMGEVLSLAFSPNGATLASGSADKRLILWNVTARPPSGQRLSAMINSDWVRSVAFSPDGTMLASGHSGPGGFNDVFLWSVDTRRQLDLRLVGQTVAFSPDGRMFASGVWDGSIRLWNVADGKPLEPPLAAHTSGVRSIAFSPDGKMLASGSEDHTIILWDVAARRPLGQPLTDHQAKVLSVAFRPDGNMLASGSEDRTTILWDVSFDSWQRRACRIVNRNLTQAEWNQFVGPDTPYKRTCENLPSGG
jgi:WD40 repeat protein